MLSEAAKFYELMPIFFDFSRRFDIPLEMLVILCGVESDAVGGVRYDSDLPEFSAELMDKARKYNPDMSDEQLNRELNARAGIFMMRYAVALELGFEGPLKDLFLPSQNTKFACKFLSDKGVSRGTDLFSALALYHTGRRDGVLPEMYVCKAHRYLSMIKRL